VVAGFSLVAPKGSTIALVGPSGCGKTTLLALVSGLLKPTSGTVKWTESDFGSTRHKLTMMFQGDTLLPWKSLRQNIELGLRLAYGRGDRLERTARIDELVTMAGLAGSEHLYPYQLSGGMRRRAAFLTAVAPLPRVLLLDEPFSSLDEPTRVAVHQDIFNIIKRYDITVLLVTHDLGEALSLSDKVVILTGRPASVHASYEVPFGRDRQMLALRKDGDFLRLYGQLWEELFSQVELSRRQASRGGAGAGEGTLAGSSNLLAELAVERREGGRRV
jgi:NitT/TauT family transport system ATP-binding protein